MEKQKGIFYLCYKCLRILTDQLYTTIEIIQKIQRYTYENWYIKM